MSITPNKHKLYKKNLGFGFCTCKLDLSLYKRNKISYLTVHLYEKVLSDKDACFDMTHVREEESHAFDMDQEYDLLANASSSFAHSHSKCRVQI